ncbi:MAG: hypothetical protein HQ538_01775 [Parcubacteria group bacterium]|nr:hypothetical protein [Parcubacteria group bacterium]
MSEKLIVPNVEQVVEGQKITNRQAPEKQEIAQKVYNNYDTRKDNRNRILDFWRFDSNDNARNCIDYWNDSEKRANSFSFKPEWKDDWQENIFNGITNAKIWIYIAQYINQEDKIAFEPAVGVNKLIRWLAKFVGEIYNYVFGTLINEKLEKLKRALYCMTFGTVIVGVEYNKKKDKFTRKIKSINNIYPDNIFEFEMQEQSGVSEELDLTWPEFVKRFQSGFWEDLDLVPKNGFWYGDETEMQFKPFAAMEGDKVKVLIDYDRHNKLIHANANGILISKKHSPFPDEWIEDDEGVIPMAKTVFEMFSPFFFYGRSLPDKLQNMQDVDNKLWNMMLDQMKLSINSPLLVGMGDDDVVAGGWHYPGSVWQLSQPEKAQWLKGGEPGNAIFKAIQDIEGSMDRMSNIDPSQQAVAGGSKTAREVTIAKQSGDVIANLFNLMMNDLEGRLVNITMPQLKKAMGSPKLREFVTENVKLVDPIMAKRFTTGDRIIRIKDKVKKPGLFGFRQELKDQAIIGQNEKTELWEFTKDVFSKIKVKMKPITDTASQQEKKFKKDIFAKLGLSIFQDERKEKIIGLLATEAGLDPDEWMKEMSEEDKTEAGLPPELQNALGQQTEGNVVPTVKSQLNQAAQSV